MRTRLELISSGTIDMYDDIPISLNFSIADISTPDKRNATFSKTIKLPGTANNNKLFGHIFEIDIYSNFNPNIKSEIILYVDGIENLRGFLRVISIDNSNDKIDYNCSLIGNIGNIYTSMGDSFLTDLDMSEHNHVYNKTNIVASWTATVGEGYVYPMIDVGANNGRYWNVEHFYPAIYVKEYIDKIFAYNGYTYTSTFFNTDFFKRLIIPYCGGTMRSSEAAIAASNVSVANNATQYIDSLNSPFSYAVNFQTETSDPSGFWNTNYFQPDSTSDYVFDVTFTVDKSSVTPTTSNDPILIEIIYYAPGATVPEYLYVETAYYNNIGTVYTFNAKTLPHEILGNGIVKVRVSGTGGFTINTGATLTATRVNGDLRENDDIELSKSIFPKVKQKDFLTSIIKMFNLYLDTDKSIYNNLFIEPRNDFYLNGEVKDWTSKIDLLYPIVSNPVGSLSSKKYIYTYKEDRDYYNEAYKSAYNEVYGTRTIEVLNDFVSGESKLEVIFSPTVLIRTNSNDRIISTFVKSTTGISARELSPVNIRILYYQQLATTDEWGLVEASNTITPYNNYPYAGHLDNPYNPTIDLCFGVPKEVAYDTTLYTNNNLFNGYWKQYLEEIIDPNSKTVLIYSYLNPVDIYQLDFRDEFYIDGHLLRLNKVEDYDPVNIGSSKCEFIKIKNKPSLTSAQTSSVGGLNVSVTGTAFT